EVQLAQDAQALAAESVGAADRPEALRIERGLRADRLEKPLELDRRLLDQVLRRDLGREALPDSGQVDDVVDEVADVVRGGGAGDPIMPREGLVELDPEELADERGEAELLAAEELRGDHRVEDVRKAESEVALQAGQVVVRAVKDLKVPALEDRAERLEVADR